MPPSYRKNRGKNKGKPARTKMRDLTHCLEAGTLDGMIPELPSLTGDASAWIIIAVKALAATGFMTAANFVILYAC
jgi:hypothetical protein